MSVGAAAVCLLAMFDASGSVDAQEYKLQIEATAAAIQAPETVQTIERAGGIAVMAAEFSGGVTLMVDWYVVRNEHDARVFASALLLHKRVESGSTAVGDALQVAAAAFDRAPPCERRVVDLSTDGWQNTGSYVEEGVSANADRGIVVNTLVIEDGTEPGLVERYQGVINGFALPATWETYDQAIKQKLNLEIAYAPRLLQPDFHGSVPYEPFARVGSIREFYQFGFVDQDMVAVLPGDDARRRRFDYGARERVPEPATAALFGFGLVILAAAVWRAR